MVKARKEDPSELASLSNRLRITCAAVRANLDMHVRAEENELWPLFNEHFSYQEQEEIVGSIIGNTGAPGGYLIPTCHCRGGTTGTAGEGGQLSISVRAITPGRVMQDGKGEG